MIARTTPSLHTVNPDAELDASEEDIDRRSGSFEPVSPAEAPRQQLLALAPSPVQLGMLGAGIAAALAGAAAGYWLGKRRAQRPARPVRHIASTFDSVLELAPVAMHLIANPIVRALALRMLTRQISRRFSS